MKKKSEKLTPRQWKLLNYLKEHGKTNVREIVIDLSDECDYELDYSIKSHNPCLALCLDADAITSSVETEKIVLHDRKYNFWLAEDKQDAISYAERIYLYPALRKLKKYWNIKKLVELDGQGKFIDTRGNVIDEKSHARDFVESFWKEVIESED